MTIRIHDYTNLPARQILRAQRIVTDRFQSIGVNAAWAEAIRPRELLANPQLPAGPANEDLMVIVLSPEMSRRLPPGRLGSAAVAEGGPGRVAYLLLDRVRAAARKADVDEIELAGLVMAHELGHLLLPHNAHTAGGLMRGSWDKADFREIVRDQPGFSSDQGTLIRHALADRVRTAN